VADAWSRYPGYAIDLVPLRGIGRAVVGDVVVAQSGRCLLVRESDHRDVLYFPRDSIVVPVDDSERTTTCPFKGEARHGNLSIGDVDLDDVAWWYPAPRTEVAGLVDHVSFYADRVEVTASIPFADGGGSTSTFPIWGTAGDLVELMDVAANGEGRFIAPTYPNPPIGTFFDLEWHDDRRVVVEGGQLLGAAIVAAAKNRPDQRLVRRTCRTRRRCPPAWPHGVGFRHSNRAGRSVAGQRAGDGGG
jgi:acyl-CoA thioesterase-2